MRTLALAPGRRGGLDAQVPVLAPSTRSWSLTGVLRSEVEWADVLLLVGAAASLQGSGRLGRSVPPVVVDDGHGPRAVAPGPPITPAERAAARSLLGVGDRPTWLLVHDAADRRRARAARVGPDGSVRLTLDDPELRDAAIAAADVAVSPIPVDAVPLGLLEAAGRGVPVVAVDSGGVGELVDVHTGALVADDPARVDAAISELLCDEFRRVTAGAAAAERVRSVAAPGPWAGAWLQRCTAAVP